MCWDRMEADNSSPTLFGDVNCYQILPDMPCLKCTGRGQRRPDLEKLRLPQVALLEMQQQKDVTAMPQVVGSGNRERIPRFGKGRAQMRQKRCSSGLSGERSMSSISTLSEVGRTSPFKSSTASISSAYRSDTADAAVEGSDRSSHMQQEAELVHHDVDSISRKSDRDSKYSRSLANISVVGENDPHLKDACSAFS